MQTRPRLVTSIPFWVLVVASLAAVIGGLVIVFRQVDAIQALVNDPNATVVTVYVAQSWVSVGAAVIAAGAIGIASALAVAAVVTTRARADVAVETIDWSNDDETSAEPFSSSTSPFATSAATTATPLAVEDADVETPSNTPAPPQAAAAQHDAPRLDAGDDASRR